MKILKIAGVLLLVTLLFTTGAFSADLPKLIDVGADKCIPCIKMAPILEGLRNDFAGRLDVRFVDAWKNRQEAASYGVQMIPTQIFYAADGKELYRHTGFFAREDILNTWRQLGYNFQD